MKKKSKLLIFDGVNKLWSRQFNSVSLPATELWIAERIWIATFFNSSANEYPHFSS